MLEPPQVEHSCQPVKHEGDLLEILCDYRLHTGDEALLKAQLKFLISYTLLGEDPVDPNDLDHFAFANGTYHSWPFVRQCVFDLTARMGYPPFNLPVFKFFPKRPKTVDAPSAEPAQADEQTKATPEDALETINPGE